jgi:hypothetical protein
VSTLAMPCGQGGQPGQGGMVVALRPSSYLMRIVFAREEWNMAKVIWEGQPPPDDPIYKEPVSRFPVRLSSQCSCGSNLPRRDLRDAHGGFCAYVCDRCEAEKRIKYLTDSI